MDNFQNSALLSESRIIGQSFIVHQDNNPKYSAKGRGHFYPTYKIFACILKVFRKFLETVSTVLKILLGVVGCAFPILSNSLQQFAIIKYIPESNKRYQKIFPDKNDVVVVKANDNYGSDHQTNKIGNLFVIR